MATHTTTGTTPRDRIAAGDELGAHVDASGGLDVAQRSPELVDVGAIDHEHQLAAIHQRNQCVGRLPGEALPRLGCVDPDDPHGELAGRSRHVQRVAVDDPHPVSLVIGLVAAIVD